MYFHIPLELSMHRDSHQRFDLLQNIPFVGDVQ